MNMGGVSAEILHVSQLITLDTSSWRELTDSSVVPNACFGPDYLLPLTAPRIPNEDEWFVVAREAERIVGLMPVSSDDTRNGRRMPHMTTGGSHRDPAYWRVTPLVSPDRSVEVLDTMFRAISQRFDLGLLELHQVEWTGEFRRSVEEWARLRNGVIAERWNQEAAVQDVFGLPSGPWNPDGAFSELSRNRRRLARRLGDRVGPELRFQLIEATPDAIEEFVRLEASSWKGDTSRGGMAIAVNPHLVDGFASLMVAHDKNDRLFFYRWGTPDAAVYMSVVLRAGDRAYAFRDAFDQKLAEFSPGMTGRLFSVHHLQTSTAVTLLDTCIHGGKTPEAAAHFSGRLPLANVWVAHHGVRAKSYVRAIEPARRLRRIAKRVNDSADE